MNHPTSQEHSSPGLVPKSKRLAADRWKILRDNVLSTKAESRLQSYSSSSVRSFSSFDLFTVTKHFIPDESSGSRGYESNSKPGQKALLNRNKYWPTVDAEKWVHYTASLDKSIISRFHDVDLIVKFVSEKQSLETLMGFDNTGNVCVWPSEEVMAYYCLKHFEMFKGTSVCEVGGGMTSLSGLMLASTCLPSKVMLTDGNQRSVDNVKEVITANECLTGIDVSAEVILWDQSFLGKPSVHDSLFDYVLCADCLFFTSVHSELVQVIFKLLKFRGEALIFAPKRSGSLEQFCRVAGEYFDLQTLTKYDDIVWLKHEVFLREDENYKTDIHYPILILLKKIYTVKQ